jgi:hypothetical protein
MNKKSKRNHRPSPRQRFPWWWLAVGAVLVLILGGLGVVWTSSSRNPAVTPAVNGSARLAVDRTLVDEGYIKLNTTIRSEFRLSNVGDQPLRILEEPRVEIVEGC